MIIIWFYLLNPARPHLFWSPMQVTLIYTSMTVPSSPTVPTRLDLINDLALCCNLASHGVVTTLPVGRVVVVSLITRCMKSVEKESMARTSKPG